MLNRLTPTHLAISVFCIALSSLAMAEPNKNNDTTNHTREIQSSHQNHDQTKLLFIQNINDTCKLFSWDPFTTNTQILYSSPTCPEDLFVAEGKNSVFITNNQTLIEIQYIPDIKIKNKILLPKPITKEELSRNKSTANSAYILSTQYYANKPGAAGVLTNGNIGLVTSVQLPADDAYYFLYELRDKQWVLLEERHCGRFERCKFEQLKGRCASCWRDERRIWHPNHLDNPLIDNHNLRNKQNGSPKLIYQINNQESVLSYSTITGPDTGATLTYYVKLKVHGKQEMALTNEQCDTSLAHKYLLLQKYWADNGLKLIDIETGEVIFDNLITATWIN